MKVTDMEEEVKSKYDQLLEQVDEISLLLSRREKIEVLRKLFSISLLTPTQMDKLEEFIKEHDVYA